VFPAIVVDPLALDELERQVRLPVQGAGVEQPRDVGMVQARQEPPLALEPFRVRAGPDRGLEQLDRAPALEPSVVPGRQPHLAHPAAPEQPFDGVGAGPHPSPVADCGRKWRARQLEEAVGVEPRVGVEHVAKLPGGGRVGGLEGVEHRRPIARRQVQRPVEKRTKVMPALRIDRTQRQPPAS
jgi:hypothetical protein